MVGTNVVHRVIDSAEIYARCESLFVYARGAADAPAAAISPNDVKRALFLMIPSLLDVGELGNEIDRFALAGEDGSDWPEV